MIKTWLKRFRKVRAPNFSSKWYERLWHKGLKAERFTLRLLGNFSVWLRALSKTLQRPQHSLKIHHYLNPVYWFAWTLQFFLSWLSTRPTKDLITTLPAGVVLILTSMAIIRTELFSGRNRESQYQQILNESLNSKDYDTAYIAAGVLLDISPSSLKLQFLKGYIDSMLDNSQQARSKMEYLSMVKRMGQAANWLLREFKSPSASNWDDSTKLRFVTLCEIAIEDEETTSAGLLARANYYFETKQYELALSDFQQLNLKNSDYLLTIATIQNKLGLWEASKHSAILAEKHFMGKLRINPSAIEDRKNCAKALILSEQEDLASQLLIDGFNYSQGESKQLRISAGEALVMRAQRFEKQASEETPDKFVYCIEAAKNAAILAPESQVGIEYILELTEKIRDNRDEFLTHVQKAMLHGVSPEATHFFMGLVASSKANSVEANLHFKVIGQSIRELPYILKNLAAGINTEAELPWAKIMLENALEVASDIPSIRGTHGIILFKMNNYAAAMVELRAALNQNDQDAVLHEYYAKCLESRGDSMGAADSFRRANELKNKGLGNESGPKL